MANEAAARDRGTGFERMRGAWLDRLLGHAKICAALDDPWGAAAYAIECEAVGQGDTVAAWLAALGDASARAWPLRACGLEVTGQFARVAIGVARMASERRPAEAAEARADVVASVALLLARDVEIDLARPRYRWRLPWTGAGLAAFHAQLAPIFAEVPAAQPVVPDAAAALARAETAAAAWRAQLRRGAEPSDFPARTGDGDAELAACRARVHAECDALLARDRAWPEPLRVHHARAVRAAASAAGTPVELDLACTHAAACFEIEATWLRALVATIGAPLRAALVASYEPSEAATASIAAARAHATALAGAPDPFALRWFSELVTGSLVPHARGSLDGLGSYLGEGGIELLGPWRTWTGVTSSPPAAARALTATGAPADPARQRIALWDREVALDDATGLRSAPARPAPEVRGPEADAT
jgi:hypothetical protein